MICRQKVTVGVRAASREPVGVVVIKYCGFPAEFEVLDRNNVGEQVCGKHLLLVTLDAFERGNDHVTVRKLKPLE